MQDVEFTVEDGELFLLQTRAAKRPAQASVRFACDAVDEGMLDREAAIATIDAGALEALLHPGFDPDHEYTELARGVPASPGAAQGAIVFTAEEAVEQGGGRRRRDPRAPVHRGRGRRRLSRRARDPHRRGRQVLARRAGRARDGPALRRRRLGARNRRRQRASCRVGETEISAGERIAIDGSTGLVTQDEVELIAPRISDEFERVLGWADEIRRLGRARERRPRRGRRAGALVRRRGDRALPDRAHVLRRGPRGAGARDVPRRRALAPGRGAGGRTRRAPVRRARPRPPSTRRSTGSASCSARTSPTSSGRWPGCR